MHKRDRRRDESVGGEGKKRKRSRDGERGKLEMKGENKDGEETGPVNEKLLCGQQRPFKRPQIKVTQGGEILGDVMSPGRGTTGLSFAQNLHLVAQIRQNSW